METEILDTPVEVYEETREDKVAPPANTVHVDTEPVAEESVEDELVAPHPLMEKYQTTFLSVFNDVKDLTQEAFIDDAAPMNLRLLHLRKRQDKIIKTLSEIYQLLHLDNQMR